MPTLHIEHPITNLETWLAAYKQFAVVRRQSGVRAELVRQPLDDPNYIFIDLDFDTVDEANAFLGFLNERVWANRENSPGLAGRPETRMLEQVVIS